VPQLPQLEPASARLPDSETPSPAVEAEVE